MSKSAEELLNEAERIYAQGKAKFANIGYPVHPGKIFAPMSSLTQKAREYQERNRIKGAPYAKKLEAISNKPNEGLSPEQTQGLLDRIRQSQLGANEDIGLRALRTQFGSSFTPRQAEGYRSLTRRDIESGLGEFSGKLQELNRTAGNLEGVKNAEVAKVLQSLQADKQARREGLIGNLEQFGAQKHALTNKKLESDRARFFQEAEDPQRRLEQLRATLEPLKARLAASQSHPDIEQAIGQEINKALQDYKMGNAPYPGKTVADLTPEMQSAYKLLERINPSMKDTYAPQRKEIIGSFLGNDTMAAKGLQNVPANIQGKITQLEDDARDRMSKDLAAINNQYIRLGQYGSPQHMRAAEQRAQELNKQVLQLRNNYINKALNEQINTQYKKEMGDLEKLKNMGGLGHKEFTDTMGNIRGLNKLGTTKLSNEQATLEDAYRNYITQLNWGRPQMDPTAMQNTQNAIFGNNVAHGLQLEDLANIRPTYSETERERNGIPNDIRTTSQAQQAYLQAQQREQQRAQQQAQQQTEQQAQQQAQQRILAHQAQQAQQYSQPPQGMPAQQPYRPQYRLRPPPRPGEMRPFGSGFYEENAQPAAIQQNSGESRPIARMRNNVFPFRNAVPNNGSNNWVQAMLNR